jgi:hypothetical protein
MPITISNVTRRVVYSASGTGPYAFTFEILANTDIAVFKDDTLLTLTTDYTVTIASNGTGSITLVAAPTGATQIAIVGNRNIQRTTDFVTGGDFFANTVNDEMDQQTIFAQQNAEGLQRALSAPQTDPTSINMTLPRASLRANKALGFDANGNPVIADTLGTNRGNWASGTLYYVRDIIKDTTNNNIWQVIVQHTSSGSLPIGTNADAAKFSLLVDAAAASTSATNAATSASAASTSASAASTSATAASGSASTASTQASNASTSASNASSSASAASSSASTASTQATNAGTSATAAASSASSASSSASAASTSASNASTSASNASTSASGASTSATNAANSASTATTQATNASTSASNASTSATNAATSASSAATAQTAAESARDATLAAYDSFDDRYLGAKTSNPTVDNDGNALVAGALYFNSVSGAMQLWTGSAWVAAYVSGSGYLAAANNLSDVANTTTARTNIGAGDVTLTGTQTLTNKTLTAPTIASANLTTALTVTGASGTSGQVLTSGGSGAAPTWSTIASSGSGVTVYTNVTTATTYTLTSTSNATIEIDAQAFGIKVVLPNATTLSASGSAYLIRNVGNFPILIEDSTNVAIGGVPASLQVQVGLNSTATAAGSWILNQDACFSTEVAQVQTMFNDNIRQLIRLSSTRFAIVAPSSGFTVSIQGFSISGDTVTSGTLTGVSASETFVEARAVTGNRLLVTTFTGTTFSSFIVDLSTIASPTVGTAATISTTAVNTLLRFDQKPVNDIGVTDAAKLTSGNLTGTNIYVYLYRSTTTGTWQGNSIDVGASGTTGTVGTEYSTGALGTVNTYLGIAATVITSSTIGFGIIFNSGTTGICYAFTASISGGVWSVNANNFRTASGSLANSVSMTYSSRAFILATRPTNNGIWAVEFPATGNAAPTSRDVAYTGVNPQQLSLTASRIVLTYIDGPAIETFAYTLGSSLASDQYFSNTGSSTNNTTVIGLIDTSTCNTFATSSGSPAVLYGIVYVAPGVLNYKRLNFQTNPGAATNLFGFQGATTNFFSWMTNQTNSNIGASYGKIMRGTTDTTPNYVVKKNYGATTVAASAVTIAARYYFNLGKFLVAFRSGNQTIVPVSATTTNGFLGSSGFKDFQLGGGVGAQESIDLDSSRAIFVQTGTAPDSGVSALTDPTEGSTNVRFSLVRIANV